MLPFSLQNNCCALTIRGFPAVFAASEVAGLQHMGCIAGKERCYGHVKKSTLKPTIWQMQFAKVGQYFGKTAMLAGRAVTVGGVYSV
jgi:hypothetical protein